MANIYENNKVESTQEEVNFRTALDATRGMILIKTKWGIVVPVGGVDEEDLKNGIAKIKEIESKCSSPFEMMAAVQTWMAGLEELDDVEEIENSKNLVIDYKKQIVYDRFSGEVLVKTPIHLSSKSEIKAVLLALLKERFDKEQQELDDEKDED